jgi:hypothetical protein
LGLSGIWRFCWNSYIVGLRRDGIRLGVDDDSLVWTGHPTGIISANAIYSVIFNSLNIDPVHWWMEKIWMWNLPIKIKCFMWLCLNKKILTWDSLLKRGWQGPGICCLCKSAEETIEHLFVHCVFTKNIWYMLKCHLKFDVDWGGVSLENNLQLWINKNKSLKALPSFTCWGIWCYRNSLLFNNKVHPLEILVNKIIFSFQEHQKQPREKYARTISDLPMTKILVKGFFDGAAQWGVCGAGFVLHVNQSSFFRGWMVGGVGTNTKVEMLGLWVLLSLALKLEMDCLQVYGDSQVVINWISGKGEIKALSIIIGAKESGIVLLPLIELSFYIFSGN